MTRGIELAIGPPDSGTRTFTTVLRCGTPRACGKFKYINDLFMIKLKSASFLISAKHHL